MNTFAQFGIEKITQRAQFTGPKITVGKVLNREIIVNAYRIVDSKFEGKRLDIDILLNDELRLLWTGRKSLMEAIQLVPKDGFPFKATIIFENEIYQFS